MILDVWALFATFLWYADFLSIKLFLSFSFHPGALCFAELGTIVPKSGAQYAYLHAAFGGPVAYMYAWTAITVTKPSSVAIMILACADYAIQPFYEGSECGPPRIVVKLVAACAIRKYLSSLNFDQFAMSLIASLSSKLTVNIFCRYAEV